MNKVSQVKFEGDLKKAVLKAVEEIGGFGRFIKKGEVVFLKPNFNTADPFPASTDLEFLKAVISLVYDYGAKLVMVGDSATMTMNTRQVMEELNVFDLEEMEQPARVYVFEEGGWLDKKIPYGKYLRKVSLPEILGRADKLILLPCLKTHFQARFTGSLKLSVGFMKPVQRAGLHLRNIQEKIAELNKLINPNLIIMDARKCFINEGPDKGEVREPGLILASRSRMAIDIEGIKIIQSFKGNSLANFKPQELTQIKRAKEIGIK